MCINLDKCRCLSLREHSTRGNKLKLQHFLAKFDIRKYVFAIRAVNLWNALTNGAVGSKMINNRVNKFE